MTKKLTKLDTALDVIAAVFFDAAEGKITKDGEEIAPRNRQAWAQRDILQAIAWKANSALDRTGGADQRMDAIRQRARDMAAKPQDEFDHVEAQRIATDADFWSFQQSGLQALMSAASDALVRHGHEAYVRQDLSKRRTVSADMPQKTQADVAAVFANLGVELPERS